MIPENNLPSVDELWSEIQQSEVEVFRDKFVRDSYDPFKYRPIIGNSFIKMFIHSYIVY